MNTCTIYKYNWFWLWLKLINDSIKKSHWLNVKCEMTNYFIIIILLFWTSNFYDLKFLNLLTISQLLNIQIMQKLTKLYNNSITNSWCIILWEDMYNSIQHAFEKRADTWKNKIYYNSYLFLCDNDKTF